MPSVLKSITSSVLTNPLLLKQSHILSQFHLRNVDVKCRNIRRVKSSKSERKNTNIIIKNICKCKSKEYFEK